MNQNDTKKETEQYLDGGMYADMVRGGAAQLRCHADEVNQLNVFPVPDGDTGDNMRMTIEGGVSALEGMHSDNLAEVTKKLSEGMLLGARGNSGVILSQFFAGMTKGFAGHEKADSHVLGEALKEGVKQAYSSVITPTEGTILTVAREAVEYAVARIRDDSTIQSIFSDLTKEMYCSLQRTPEILPVLKEAGVIDSGGAGLFYILQGFYKILSGEPIAALDDIPFSAQNEHPIADFSVFGPDSEMTYGYCTELLLQLQNKKVAIETFDPQTIIDFLVTVGDSIVCFKTGSIIKLHVHTMTPDAVLGFCRKFGEFLTVKIENMSVQHHEQTMADGVAAIPKTQISAEKPINAPKKKFGAAAVASGAGMEALFRTLGVDAIVSGGQTQNPSAQDFLSAFDEVNAETIFVFPNNSNIIMAAKQAAQMYKGSHIYVIESKNIGQGYAAISSLNFQSDDPDAIAEMLSEAMQTVTTGYISTSVRDAALNGVNIKCGDYIGFVDKEMIASEHALIPAAEKLLAHMAGEGNEVYIITAFLGKDVNADAVDSLQNLIDTAYPDVEFYTVDGGQDVYPLIFVVE